MRTLAIDIGGTGLKLLVLDEDGSPITDRARTPTPHPATPTAVLDALVELAGDVGFDRISCGFPGVVVEGVTLNAPNLDPSWEGHPLSASLAERFGKPARVANDADVQGLAVIEGTGVELVITLGTGVGSALFVDGRLVPNLELGHAPFRKSGSYEAVLGDAGRRTRGNKRWRVRLDQAIGQWRRLFNPRRIYLGGGNAKRLDALPEGVVTVDNKAGLWGGIALWR